jgi:hypothetical protein
MEYWPVAAQLATRMMAICVPKMALSLRIGV